MDWLLLFAAIGLEVCGTTCMKLAEGFTKPIPSVLLVVFYLAAFTCLTFAIRTIEIGIAYAIWAGVGTAVIAVIGIYFFGESTSTLKVVSLTLVIAGVVGLNLVSPHAPPPVASPPEQLQPIHHP